MELQPTRFRTHNFYFEGELSLFLALTFLFQFSLYKLDNGTSGHFNALNCMALKYNVTIKLFKNHRVGSELIGNTHNKHKKISGMKVPSFFPSLPYVVINTPTSCTDSKHEATAVPSQGDGLLIVAHPLCTL